MQNCQTAIASNEECDDDQVLKGKNIVIWNCISTGIWNLNRLAKQTESCTLRNNLKSYNISRSRWMIMCNIVSPSLIVNKNKNVQVMQNVGSLNDCPFNHCYDYGTTISLVVFVTWWQFWIMIDTMVTISDIQVLLSIQHPRVTIGMGYYLYYILQYSSRIFNLPIVLEQLVFEIDVSSCSKITKQDIPFKVYLSLITC